MFRKSLFVACASAVIWVGQCSLSEAFHHHAKRGRHHHAADTYAVASPCGCDGAYGSGYGVAYDGYYPTPTYATYGYASPYRVGYTNAGVGTWPANGFRQGRLLYGNPIFTRR